MASDENTPQEQPSQQENQNRSTPPTEDFTFKTNDQPTPVNTTSEDNNPSSHPSAPRPTSGVVKNRKRLFIIGGIIVVLLAVVVAAWLYYSNPKKVMADALAKTLSADTGSLKGTATFDSKDQNTPVKMSIDFDAAQSKEAGKIDAKAKMSFGAADLNIDASLITTKEDSYLKINNAKQLSQFATVLAGGNQEMAKAFDPLMQQIDNRWIEINQQEQEASPCSAALLQAKLSNDDQKTLKKLFENNQFLKTKDVGSSFSEHHYSLTFDKNAGQKFLDESLNLASFKKIKEACDTDSVATYLKKTSESTDEKPTVKAELWVNRWNHKPTKIMISAEDSEATLSLTSDIKLGDTVTINKPTDATPLQEITKEFQEQVFKSMMESQATGGN